MKVRLITKTSNLRVVYVKGAVLTLTYLFRFIVLKRAFLTYILHFRIFQSIRCIFDLDIPNPNFWSKREILISTLHTRVFWFEFRSKMAVIREISITRENDSKKLTFFLKKKLTIPPRRESCLSNPKFSFFRFRLHTFLLYEKLIACCY